MTNPPSANKATHSGFETQGRRHQKFKTGVSVAHQMFYKNFFKRLWKLEIGKLENTWNIDGGDFYELSIVSGL